MSALLPSKSAMGPRRFHLFRGNIPVGEKPDELLIQTLDEVNFIAVVHHKTNAQVDVYIQSTIMSVGVLRSMLPRKVKWVNIVYPNRPMPLACVRGVCKANNMPGYRAVRTYGMYYSRCDHVAHVGSKPCVPAEISIPLLGHKRSGVKFTSLAETPGTDQVTSDDVTSKGRQEDD